MRILTAVAIAFLSLALPAAAETWWLVVATEDVLLKIPTYTEEECDAAGKKIYDSKKLSPPHNMHDGRRIIVGLRYLCVKGK